MNDQIINKIRKLLALSSNNPSQDEAEAAMMKAQAVAMEHGINIALIGMKEDKDISDITKDVIGVGQRLPVVHKYVRNILQSFFNIKILTSGNRAYGIELYFIGSPDDISTARYVYTWLSDAMVKCWKKYYANNPMIPLSHKASYLSGFHFGLSKKLKANKEQIESKLLTTVDQSSKYAVAVIDKNKKIEDFIENQFGKVTIIKDKPKQINVVSFEQGIKDGTNCNIAKGAIAV